MTKNYFYIFICLVALSACSSDEVASDVPDIDLTWEDEDLLGASAMMKGFECGDMATRSSWEFNGQKMVFGWEAGDAIGLYPTAGTADPAEEGEWEQTNPTFINPTEKKHPLYDKDHSTCHVKESLAQSMPFFVSVASKDSQSQQLFGGSGDFEWDDRTRWTAYLPYNSRFSVDANPSVKFNALPLDYTNQTQMELPDMEALYLGKDGTARGYNNPYYIASEIASCKHLAQKDYCISPEMVWTGQRIKFEFQHIGAIARFFLLAPEENLTLEKLELICDRKIFHAKAEVDLTSHLYDANALHRGVKVAGDEGPLQIKATDDASQKLTLNFTQTKDLKVQKPTTENRYGNYIVAYMMVFPVEYKSETDGNLFVYVTARNEQGKEVHFVSEPLADRTLRSGYYYQWNLRTHPDDGLYPIELTATLLPWQDIVGAGINTDLEK